MSDRHLLIEAGAALSRLLAHVDSSPAACDAIADAQAVVARISDAKPAGTTQARPGLPVRGDNHGWDNIFKAAADPARYATRFTV